MVGDPFSGDPRAVAPIKGPPLLVTVKRTRIAARVQTISGDRMGGGRCNRREGAGDAVPEGVEGGSSGATVTERCVSRVRNLGELFASRAIVDDGEKVN